MGRSSQLRRAVTAGVLVSLLVSGFGPGLAGAPAGAEPAGSDAPPDVIDVGPVTITATRAERDLLEVPGNVTLIDRESIDRSGAASVPDLLRREAGLFVTSTTTNPAGVQVEARGFNNGGALGSGLLVRVDGRRVNEADTGNVDWSLLPLDQVESIEIVRGPASALYGDNAVGGVIEIRTRAAEGPARATLRGRYGRHHSGGGSLDASATLAPESPGVDSVTLSLFAEGFLTDGYRDRSGYERWNLQPAVQVTLGDRVMLGASGGYHHDERDFPGALSQQEIAEFGRRASDPGVLDDGSEVKRGFAQGWLRAQLAEDVELRVEPFFNDRNDDVTITSLVFGATQIDTDKLSAGVGTQLRVDRPLAGLRSRLLLGFDYLHEETDRDITSAFGTNLSDNERDVYGAFLQQELWLVENLLLAAGVRYDHARLDLRVVDPALAATDPSAGSAADDPVFHVWSPRVALTWRVRPQLSAYASYARGFRLPNFDEDAPLLGFEPGQLPTLPDLEPQISDAFEVGARYRGERVRGAVAVYYMNVRNEITFDPFTFANANFERVRHRGVELSLAFRPLGWLELTGSYTFEDVEIREADDPTFVGRRMPITPRNRGSVGALATLPWSLPRVSGGSLSGEIALAANANLVGERILANDFDRSLEELDPYTTLDLLLALRPRLSEWMEATLQLALRNVTDEEYAGFGARFDVFDPDSLGFVPTAFFNPAAKRTWEVSLTWTVRR
jgi:iron complex outermembrane receptor protein